MVYDVERETPVHTSCIDAALSSNPNDPDANLMAYLLPDHLKSLYIYRCAKALIDEPDNQDVYIGRIHDLIWRPEYYGMDDITDVIRVRSSPRLKPPTCDACEGAGNISRVRVCKGQILHLDAHCYRGLRKRARLNALMDIQSHMDAHGWINTQSRLRDIVQLVEDIVDNDA